MAVQNFPAATGLPCPAPLSRRVGVRTGERPSSKFAHVGWHDQTHCWLLSYTFREHMRQNSNVRIPVQYLRDTDAALAVQKCAFHRSLPFRVRCEVHIFWSPYVCPSGALCGCMPGLVMPVIHDGPCCVSVPLSGTVDYRIQTS